MKQIKQGVAVIQHNSRIDENNRPFVEHDVDWQFELTDEEFRKCLEASWILKSFSHDVQLFKIVLWNLQEYFDALNSYKESYSRRSTTYPDNRRPELEMNRRLVNFLTSVTTYLTYTEGNLKGKYGDSSENLMKFTQHTSKAFDNHFSYRFLYHLRNYAQHGGLPITDIKFRSGPSESQQTKTEHTIEISISRDKLLEAHYNWNPTVRQDLESGPANIDINFHLIEFAQELATINAKVTDDEALTLIEPANFIYHLLQKVSRTDGKIIVVELEVIQDAEGKVTGAIPIMLHPVNVELVNAIVNGRWQDVTSNFTLVLV
jgi:hypothetical protein